MAGYSGSGVSEIDSTVKGDNRCDFKGDTAEDCEAGSLSSKKWKYPITTFRATKQ
jgi:hypothetical protein